MSDVACILGCGPAGLFAAHAIAQAGGQPVIISQKLKSEFPGAQYLQAPIPGLSEQPDGELYTVLLGTKERYAERVYGDAEVATSWPQLPPRPDPAWDLREAYDKAWDLYNEQIIDTKLGPEDIDELTARFTTVISTIPGWALCRTRRHKFKKMHICVKRQSQFPIYRDNYVVYNGMDSGGWYRCAQIFGHESTEAIPSQVRSDRDWRLGYKILGNNCTCHPNLTRAGRLGTWRRGVLTHDAYTTALAAFQERLAI